MKGAPDHYFRNDNGRFVDATLESGLEDKALGFGFSVRVADFNGDGFPDIYVANDSDPNYLYRNDGKGRFSEVGTWTGCALDENGAAQASMGVAVGDANGDGLLDIFVNNFSEDFSTLYRGLAGGLFEDVSRKSGVGPATYKTLAWGAAMSDLDHDGDLEILVMNGHIYPQIDQHPELIGSYEQRNILLDNRGPLGPGSVPTYVDVTDSAGPGLAGGLRESRTRGRRLRRRRRPRPADHPARPAAVAAPQRQRDQRGVARRHARGREGRDRADRGRGAGRGRGPLLLARRGLGRLVHEHARSAPALRARRREGHRGGPGEMAGRHDVVAQGRAGPPAPADQEGKLAVGSGVAASDRKEEEKA